MKTVSIEPITPIPINDTVLASALRLKRLGLSWSPHVGCFVWDREAVIPAPSPFPQRVYFILSLRRFMAVFGSEEKMQQQLVWVPTWHQAFQLCRRWGISGLEAEGAIDRIRLASEEDGLLGLYELIAGTLAATGNPAQSRASRVSTADGWIQKAMEADLGSLAHLPRTLQKQIRSVYHEAGVAYLGWRRIQDRQTGDWIPPETTFDAALLDDLGHFYSDYQQVIRSIAFIRKKVGRLQSIDPSDAPVDYRERVEELMEMTDRDPRSGQIMADLMDPE
jgi:hypothetical protein